MTESSTPESIELLMAGYVVGNLTAAELIEFERLLAQQPELAQEVNQLEATCDRVIAGLHEVQPPLHLWTNIRTQIDDRSSGQIQLSGQGSLPWRRIFGSLAALLILGLGVDNYRLRQASNMAGEIDALLKHSQTRLFALKPTRNSNTASGSFVVNLEQQKGILTIQHLPIPPQGQTYRLWAIVDRDRLPCGQVHIDDRGATSEQFSMPADLYDNGISGIFITLESSQLSRYPTGSAVMQSL
jgi:anti-sigma-K factor RskA